MDVVRDVGICEQTFYRWRTKFGGMGVSEARRLKELEVENRRLKTAVAEPTLDKQALKKRCHPLEGACQVGRAKLSIKPDSCPSLTATRRSSSPGMTLQAHGIPSFVGGLLWYSMKLIEHSIRTTRSYGVTRPAPLRGAGSTRGSHENRISSTVGEIVSLAESSSTRYCR